MTTLLSLCQSALIELQLPYQTVIAASTSVDARRMVRYANKAGQRIAREWNWPQLRLETTFTSVALSLQSGALPADFGRMVPETLHNRTSGDVVEGPASARDWQRSVVSGDPNPIYTLRQDPATDALGLYILPVPTAGDTYAFEYTSSKWAINAGGDFQSAFTADTDTCVFNDDLMINQMCVQWLMAEGQPSLHLEREYRTLLAQITRQEDPTSGILTTDIPRRSTWDISDG